MVNDKMWGLTLLERNLRELNLLGIKRIYITTIPDVNPLSHLCRPVPGSLDITQEIVDQNEPYRQLCSLLKKDGTPILLLAGHALNDRRVIKELLAAGNDAAAISRFGRNPGCAACLSLDSLNAFGDHARENLTRTLKSAMNAGVIAQLDFRNFNPYIENLRREIQPYILKIENQAQFREAESVLKQTVHKGVLEFVAKYIHPPLEFAGVRLIDETKITPNQVTIFWLILATLTIPLFMKGYLLIGIILAAVSGILDGVDGKLARLTLRYSKSGDLLDHVGGAIFDAIWYLALGWYFSGGNPQSTGAIFTYVLFISYLFHRIIPGLFRAAHHHEIYDYGNIDIFARLIGARMNNNIWLLLIGIVLGYAREAYYLICIWMAVTAAWYIFRFLWVTFTPKHVRQFQLTNIS